MGTVKELALAAVLAAASPVAAEPTFSGLGDPEDSFVAGGVSADGSVVVGQASMSLIPPNPSPQLDRAFRWTEAGGIQNLGELPGGGAHSNAYGVSSDGEVVVGRSLSASGGEAFRWTAATGIVGLGDLPGGSFQSSAYGVSDDGTIAVGQGRSATGTEAVIWDANGIHPLKTVFQDLGVDVTGWTLTSAEAISTDGNTIIGYGQAPGSSSTAGIVAVIPEPEHATMLLSGALALVFLRRRGKVIPCTG
jgi:probable HAF family extracellular repeat protein